MMASMEMAVMAAAKLMAMAMVASMSERAMPAGIHRPCVPFLLCESFAGVSCAARARS